MVTDNPPPIVDEPSPVDEVVADEPSPTEEMAIKKGQCISYLVLASILLSFPILIVSLPVLGAGIMARDKKLVANKSKAGLTTSSSKQYT